VAGVKCSGAMAQGFLVPRLSVPTIAAPALARMTLDVLISLSASFSVPLADQCPFPCMRVRA
jgi:hypothetical protein